LKRRRLLHHYSTGKVVRKNIKIVTLGCPKNEVDSEVMGKGIERAGFNLVQDEGDADIIIVNTCGFIESARENSIETILDAARLKETGKPSEVIVAGCLSQRYESELRRDLPEVDAFFGVEDFRNILTYLGGSDIAHFARPGRRLLNDKKYYAYLKIAEGCDNECSFCAIPMMRGLQKSRSIDSLLQETEYLVDNGIKEIILISQDLTTYGSDLQKNGNGGIKIHDLVRDICNVEGVEWIRLMYAHPSHITEELTRVVQSEKNVCNYIDMPVQHISDRILKSMRRGTNGSKIRKLLEDIRNVISDISLRTSVIVGYPGESEEEFQELHDFIEESEFDRLGVFTYSHEKNTHAEFLDDDISKELKTERMDRIMLLQQEISQRKNEDMIGKVYKVLIDEYKEDEGLSIGRCYKDAPEIDNIVVIDKKLNAGSFVNARIISASAYDVRGELVLGYSE